MSQKGPRLIVFALLSAILIGLSAYAIKKISGSAVIDPLLLALFAGVIFRSFLKFTDTHYINALNKASSVLIPPGIIFYALKNLNFSKAAQLDASVFLLDAIAILVYFSVVLYLGKILKQKPKITYLTATGSAICGASAIAITTPVVKADPDDVSISLLSVAFIGMFALFIMFPFIGCLLNMTNANYGILSGTILQFTAFVKTSMVDMPPLNETIPQGDAIKLALSIKATRYLGLLIALPLFASLKRGKFSVSYTMIIFLFAGLTGTMIYKIDQEFYSAKLIPFIKPIYEVSWSIAMAAIGLNADIKQLVTNNGIKATLMALAGFIAATGVILAYLYLV
jgi:uncharacterized integral membrane protein (TIGR00698 family)